MEYEKLKTAAETITMPEEVKHRIVKNCKTQISNFRKEIIMNTNHNNKFWGKPVSAFVVLAVCLSLSVTALATAGTLNGFFKDITNWQGAVVGTFYEQATDEIGVNITVNGDELTVHATFSDPHTFPYREAEKLGIAQYRIVDENGDVVKEGAAESSEVISGCSALNICLSNIDSGSYRLIVTAFVSEKKADQPLHITGNWECHFIK